LLRDAFFAAFFFFFATLRPPPYPNEPGCPIIQSPPCRIEMNAFGSTRARRG
jgi:hypothetical protein